MIDDGTSDSPPLDKLAKPMIYVEESSARPVMDKSPQPIVSFPTSNEEDNEVGCSFIAFKVRQVVLLAS